MAVSDRTRDIRVTTPFGSGGRAGAKTSTTPSMA